MNTVSFPQAVYAQSADGKVGLDDPRWDAVFESVDKSYKEELQKKHKEMLKTSGCVKIRKQNSSCKRLKQIIRILSRNINRLIHNPRSL